MTLGVAGDFLRSARTLRRQHAEHAELLTGRLQIRRLQADVLAGHIEGGVPQDTLRATSCAPGSFCVYAGSWRCSRNLRCAGRW